MDRERYLYRGKASDTGRWVYGYLVLGDLIREADSGWSLRTQNMSEEGRFECQAVRVDPDTVGQCTSLKDVNGELVFEGDIVILSYFDYEGNDTQNKGVIEYEDNAFCFSHEENDALCDLMFDDIEVIGNQHDTPELMESERGPYDG